MSKEKLAAQKATVTTLKQVMMVIRKHEPVESTHGSESIESAKREVKEMLEKEEEKLNEMKK